MKIYSIRFAAIIMILISMMIPTVLFSEGIATSTHDLSIENANIIIDRVYLDILHRYPDEHGLYTYSKFLVEDGKSEEWLRDVLLNSEEGKRVSKQQQKQTYVLFGMAALPLLLLGGIFCFRKNTKDFIFKLILIFISLFIACVLFEITLRVVAIYKDYKNEKSWQSLNSTPVPRKNAAVHLRDMIQLSKNPKLIYELMPDLSVRFIGGGVTTDKDGFRVTPGVCKQSYPYTIIGLGDSVMFGWGVHDQETYLAYLSQDMSSDCTRIINMAVPGYNTVMEVEALKEKGLALQPDLVVMHFIENDLYLPNFIRKNDRHVTLTRSYLLAALSQWRGTRLRTQV